MADFSDTKTQNEKKNEIYEYREAVNKRASSWESTTFEGKALDRKILEMKWMIWVFYIGPRERSTANT